MTDVVDISDKVKHENPYYDKVDLSVAGVSDQRIIVRRKDGIGKVWTAYFDISELTKIE